MKGKASCIRRECHCKDAYAYGDGKTKCEREYKLYHFFPERISEFRSMVNTLVLSAILTCLFLFQKSPIGGGSIKYKLQI